MTEPAAQSQDPLAMDLAMHYLLTLWRRNYFFFLF